MTDDMWEQIERIADVAALYPDGLDQPVYAGRVAWPDHRERSVENLGDVYVVTSGLRMEPLVWTGEWSREGNPMLAPGEGMLFADADQLRDWVEWNASPPRPGPPPEMPAPEEYIDAPPAIVDIAEDEYVDAAPAIMDIADGEYIGAAPATIDMDMDEYIEQVSEV